MADSEDCRNGTCMCYDREKRDNCKNLLRITARKYQMRNTSMRIHLAIKRFPIDVITYLEESNNSSVRLH